MQPDSKWTVACCAPCVANWNYIWLGCQCCIKLCLVLNPQEFEVHVVEVDDM
ncbi:hypothetical protein JOD20_003508 [Herpetosiphon giganteus]|nr:hypothetical protein [Herpetosiphon giganteus]